MSFYAVYFQEKCEKCVDYQSAVTNYILFLFQDAALAIILCVTAAVLFYCVAYGTVILNIFNPEGEGVIVHGSAAKKAGSPPELTNVLSADGEPGKPAGE